MCLPIGVHWCSLKLEIPEEIRIYLGNGGDYHWSPLEWKIVDEDKDSLIKHVPNHLALWGPLESEFLNKFSERNGDYSLENIGVH